MDLFSLDENGNIQYNSDILDNWTLYGDGVLADPSFLELPQTDTEYSSEGAELLEETVEEVSSGDVPEPAPSYTEIHYYAIYAVPASASGFPNSNSLGYLESVVNGYDPDYYYLAYRTSDDSAYPMVLYIAPEAELNGSTVSFTDCDIVEIEYIYNSSDRSYYVRRSQSHEDSLSVSLPSASIAYTNVTEGYGVFDTTASRQNQDKTVVWIGLLFVAAFILSRIIGGKNHG